MMNRRRFLELSVAAAAAYSPISRQATAQSWPTRPVRILVGIPAGSSVDATARIIGSRLSEMWGQPVVIENRTGSGGNVAAAAVARADPDGYTLLQAGTSLAVSPFLYRSLQYDPVRDFESVALLCRYPNVMVVPNSSPAHSVQGFIAYAKAKQGKATFGSAGYGTAPHLAGELFMRKAGIQLTHLPYRGGNVAMNDLIPGRIDTYFNLTPFALPLVRSKQVRGLAVTTAHRLPEAPDLPTISESGVPGFEISSWAAFFAPAKTPPDIVKKIAADVATALTDPDVSSKLTPHGVIPIGSTPEQAAENLKAEMDRWGPIIKEMGITIDK